MTKQFLFEVNAVSMSKVETSVSVHPASQCKASEDFNLQQRSCENRKKKVYLFLFLLLRHYGP